VLYFLDTYARWHDPLLAQAFVGVLSTMLVDQSLLDAANAAPKPSVQPA
jgi:hypothetical protein